MKKILCYVGYHHWVYPLKAEIISGVRVTETLTGKIPDDAKCMHCGTKYKKI